MGPEALGMLEVYVTRAGYRVLRQATLRDACGFTQLNKTKIYLHVIKHRTKIDLQIVYDDSAGIALD
jgi:hypothetical protein